MKVKTFVIFCHEITKEVKIVIEGLMDKRYYIYRFKQPLTTIGCGGSFRIINI